MKKAIYFTQEYNPLNPSKYAVCLTYDEVDGLQIIDNRQQISISTTTDKTQDAGIKVLSKTIAQLEEDLNLQVGVVEKVVNNQECSMFEVMPNKVDILSGTIDDVTGFEYSNTIPACTIHKMTLRSSQLPDECDVVIDWGDGTVSSIKDGDFVSNTPGKSYELEHDYTDAMSSDTQRFIVKIYGKNYYTFRNNSYKDNNLISRIFDKDLTIASHVSNFASMCYGANRLLSVKIPHSTKYVTNAFNFASTFEFCSNLKTVTGFEDSPLRNDCIVANIFNGCTSLETTDFVVPTCITSIAGIFNNCKKLTTKIEKIIPANGFALDNINAGAAFYNTTSLTGTIPANLLWDSNKTFKSQSAFGNSGVSPQAPRTWGGTLSV